MKIEEPTRSSSIFFSEIGKESIIMFRYIFNIKQEYTIKLVEMSKQPNPLTSIKMVEMPK